MKNVTAFALIFVLSCLLLSLTACSKDTGSAPPAVAPKAAPVPAAVHKSKCPDYVLTWEGEDRDFCEISYTSLKDIAMDGKKAVGKRAKFKCRFEIIHDGKINCGKGVAQAKVSFGDNLKPFVRKLRRGKRITIDMAIGVIGPLGPIGHAFSIK